MDKIVFSIKVIKSFLTSNPIYKKNKTIVPTAIMVHSTATPGAKASVFIAKWNVPIMLIQKLVHAFIDDTGIYQTAPWTMRVGHAGGSANNTHIGFEICEPKSYDDYNYFLNVKQRAIDLCVYLCGTYNIKPSSIICHCEGYKLGIASNHADIDHWWKKYHGYTMDDFRKDVQCALDLYINKVTKPVDPYKEPVRTLKQQDSGADVKWLQFELLESGFGKTKSKPLTIDGQFGKITLAALKQFQTTYGLTADGICGPLTIKKLKEV